MPVTNLSKNNSISIVCRFIDSFIRLLALRLLGRFTTCLAQRTNAIVGIMTTSIVNLQTYISADYHQRFCSNLHYLNKFGTKTRHSVKLQLG